MDTHRDPDLGTPVRLAEIHDASSDAENVSPPALLATVFIAGAAVLIVEVAATRVLAPHYGNTIITFSSVISVILGALSLGYCFGGVFADKYPKASWFYAIIAAAGLSVLMLQLLSLTIAAPLAKALDMMSGPLVLSCILYFLPSMLLGTLSPFAVRLLQLCRPDEGAGRLSGKVFFWSTIGSIIGSLCAGLVLVPHVGVGKVIVFVGVALMLAGVIGMIAARSGTKAPTAMIALGIALAVADAALLVRPAMTGVVYQDDGVYERITVREMLYQGRPLRALYQDRAASGMLYLDNREPTDYMRYAAAATLARPEIKRALVLGGGAFILPQHMLSIFPDVTVDAVDIEPQMHEIGKTYFFVQDSPRLRGYVADGRRFLAETDSQYDLIYADVFFGMTVPAHLTTEEYFMLARSRLSPGGVYMSNLVGQLSGSEPSAIGSIVKTMRQIFPNTAVFAMIAPESDDVQGLVTLSVNGNQSLELRSPALRDHSNPIIRGLHEHEIDLSKINLSQHVLLTDDYCPIEYLSLGALRRELEP